MATEEIFSTSDAMSTSEKPRSPFVNLFNWLDYSVFTVMLVASALVGVYYAFFAKTKQNTKEEYLMGGRKMGIFPIAMSLISSYISGNTMMGMPSEIYAYGTQYWSVVFALPFICIILATVYLPVFYKLRLTSVYEYLEIRFDRKVRLLGSVLFLMAVMFHIPFVIYIPALTFKQVADINIHLVTPIVCVVCIFYTTLGGLKAVVWTDTIQTIIMFATSFFVIGMGTIALGGLGTVWERSEASGRIEFFNFDPNPLMRQSFWPAVFGSFFMWLNYMAVNQGMVQRFLAMPSIGKARIVVVIFTVGIVVIVSTSCYAGLLIFATYHDCDPLRTKAVDRMDQVLPYLVMDIAGHIPGLPGLFVAGIFSAGLSSMSTGLNAMAGVIYEDFINPCLRVKLSEAKASTIMKIICVVIGAIAVFLVLIVEKLGGVIQVSSSLGGIAAGPMLGIFTLGLFVPWMNATGAFTGGLAGAILTSWISFGSQAAIAYGQIHYPMKPTSVEGCPHLEVTEAPTMASEFGDPFSLYRLSYLWYSAVGLLTTCVVGIPVTFLTGARDPADVDPDLLTPVIHRFLPKRRKQPVEEKLLEKHKIVIVPTTPEPLVVDNVEQQRC